MGVKAVLSSWKDRYVHFVEKQGFGIIAVLCVAVITATAVWTDRRDDSYVAPTPPVLEDISAAQLMQQPLRTAATATPAPTEEARVWTPPLAESTILRPFCAETMQQSGITGIWSIHDAVDLGAPRGSKVFAMADGVVLSTGKDRLMGVWMRIDHGDGYEALYAGMALAAAYIAGDAVHAGETIGFSGDGLLEESNLEPHLHLRVAKDGQPIDPMALWQ